MNPDLFPLKEVILLFKNDLVKLIELDKDYPIDLPNNDPLSNWQKREAYGWIFFEPRYLLFWGLSDQIKKETPRQEYPESLSKEASSYYAKWRDKKIEISGYKVTVPRLQETVRYVKYGIPEPDPSESLIQYVKRLRSLISEELYSKKMWNESLGCFLDFIRSNIPTECHGFIDVIFPEDRAFYSDTIIRLIRKDKFPTNIIFVSEILKNLSEEILWGDPRGQHCAAETLALAWICLTGSRLQLPTQINLLHAFDGASLAIENKPERVCFPKRYLLKIPTLFGEVPMEISEFLFSYLSNLFQINQKMGHTNGFFKSSERSLRRAFDRATSKLNLPKGHGEITFTTFTSWPDEDPNYRTQIDNSRYRLKITKS